MALCVLPPKHLRNQKLSLRCMSSKYPRKLRCVYVRLVAIKFIIMYDVESTAVAATSFFTGMFPKNWTKQEEKWTIQKNTKKQK